MESEEWPHTPVEQVSLVQVLPSLQSAAVVHPTHTRIGPDVTHTGEPAVHPTSIMTPGAVSRHGKHMGELIAPSHTPPAQAVPCENDGFEHVFEAQRSFVQTFPSLQSPSPMHRTHTGIAPEVSHIGVPAVHPLSVAVPA